MSTREHDTDDTHMLYFLIFLIILLFLCISLLFNRFLLICYEILNGLVDVDNFGSIECRNHFIQERGANNSTLYCQFANLLINVLNE